MRQTAASWHRGLRRLPSSGLLDPDIIARAVALQRNSYALLRWMADHATERVQTTLHSAATLPDSFRAWLMSSGSELPAELRVVPDDVAATANLLASYLETTFDFDPSPGQRRYSAAENCFCPMCSWIVDLPRLLPRTLTRTDKDTARSLQADALRSLAIQDGVDLVEDRIDALLDDRALRDPLALVAYGRDLLRRIDDQHTTPATLALWRRFAWTPEGSPRKGFVLTSEAILAAQEALRAAIAQA